MKQISQRCKVMVSACLVGHAVRYDGSDKAHKFIRDVLPQHCDVISICPEIGAGMGVPRPPVQLATSSHGVTAVGVSDPALEVGAAIQTFAKRVLPQLQGVSACVFKARSPSCSVRGIPVAGADEMHSGLFAAVVMEAFPSMLLVEEADLDTGEGQAEFLRCMARHCKSIT